jgi:hypothetical protein
MKPFDFLNIFFEKKKHPTIDEINKDCNQYILNMTLSCEKGFTVLAHELTKIKISNKMYYDFLYEALPKGKRYIQYNAGKAKKDQDVSYLMTYFGTSQQTAKEYSDIISDSEMKEIRDYYEKRGTNK